MSMMEKIKALFQGENLPDETRQLYQAASNPRELVKGLETLRARNEIDLRDNEEQLIGLEKAIIAEENTVRKGGLTGTEEMIVLRRIERLRKQRVNLEKQVSIYHENVNLHLNLIARIQEMEAMRSRGIEEDAIDRLATDVEDNVEQYKRVSIAAADGTNVVSAIDESAERRRLEELKKSIMGVKEEPPAQAVEEPQPKNRMLES